MNDTAMNDFVLKLLDGQDARLREAERAVAKLTQIAEQLTKAEEDREKRLRKAENQLAMPVHDEDHEKRLDDIESELKRQVKSDVKRDAAITANLSARELVLIGLAFTSFVTGKWDWLTGLFK
jgi:acetoin utilization deacetylase AcuC-like enzyme